jgi:hypothetical protein
MYGILTYDKVWYNGVFLALHSLSHGVLSLHLYTGSFAVTQ